MDQEAYRHHLQSYSNAKLLEEQCVLLWQIKETLLRIEEKLDPEKRRLNL